MSAPAPPLPPPVPPVTAADGPRPSASLAGRDCLGCAKTGSGKTAAFVLPVLQVLSEDPYGIFCLVLTPTRYGAAPGGHGPGEPVPEGPAAAARPRFISLLRGRELAYQIAEQFRVLGKPLGLKDCVVVGGLGECCCAGVRASTVPLRPRYGRVGKEQSARGGSLSTGFVFCVLRSCYPVPKAAEAGGNKESEVFQL